MLDCFAYGLHGFSQGDLFFLHEDIRQKKKRQGKIREVLKEPWI